MTEPNWGQRAADFLSALAAASRPGPGVTRLPFSAEHVQAIGLLRDWMEEAGLKVHLDAAGTLIGRVEGPAGTGTLLTGSHQDSVRQGGAFDGIMGVVLPLVALEKLRHEGRIPAFAVEVLAFADEEGVRFPTALLGSRALAGTLDPTVLAMTDRDGVRLDGALEGFGCDPTAIPALARDRQSVIGFLEAHIEQGPVLEQESRALGVVTSISGIERHSVVLTGETGHAGTVPMSGRRDALVGASALVLAVNRLGQETADLRATVGDFVIHPNAVNAIPNEVRLTIELRSPDDAVRISAGETLQEQARVLAEQSGLSLSILRTYSQPAVPCDQALTEQLSRAMGAVGQPVLELPSGATHDSSAMADLCGVAMLFVRCRGGISHSPQEYATPEDMGAAIDVLAEFFVASTAAA